MHILPDSAEYALRAAACLAKLEPDQRMRARDLAEQSCAPPAFLSKVMRRLVAAGLVDGVRGHHGGFKLAKQPREISVYQVLEAMDALPSADRCAFGWPRCDGTTPCPLHPMFGALRDGVLHWAATTTLDRAGPLPDRPRGTCAG